MIDKYSVRLKPIIKRDGCRVVLLYDKIISSKNYHLLNEIDTSHSLSKKFLSLLSINENFTKYILKDNYSIDFLATFLKSNDGASERLVYLIKKEFNNSSFLYQNKNYINYFLISAYFSKSLDESNKIFKKLQSSIAVDELGSFLLILDELNGIYLIDEILDLFSNLGDKRVSNILKFPAYIIYFLPPKELKNALNLKNLQESLIYMYDILKNIYKKDEISLFTIANIYPYLITNIENNEFNLILFKSFFKNFVNSRLIENLYIENICIHTDKYQLFGNLNQAIKFNSNYENSFEVMRRLSGFKNGMEEYFYIVNEYFILDKKMWNVFSDLIFNLNNDIMHSINFIKILRKKTNYFNLLNKYKDYDKFVVKNSYDRAGVSGKKYIFILKTSYPEDTNNSLIEYFYNNSLESSFLNLAIDDLFAKNIKELQNHNFTTYENVTSIVDNVENALLAVEIVTAIMATPQTMGASLGVVSAFSKKLFTKKIFKKVVLNNNRYKKKFPKPKFDKMNALQNGLFSVQIGYEILRNYPFPMFEMQKSYNGEICEEYLH